MEIRDLIAESNHIENVWDEAEVDQSMKAWDFLVGNFQALSLTAVLMTHETIMQNLNPRIAGQWRRCDVRVGSYLAPPWLAVPFMMDDWLYHVGKLSPKLSHIEFEKIHPFEDGNGRTGRMIMWFEQYLTNQTLTPILYKDRNSYYDWFLD